MDMNKNSEYPFVFSMIIKMEVNMLFKDDWDKSKQRLEALWNNEIIDRACISVTALKDSHNYVREKMPESPEDLFHYFTDGEWVHKRQMHRFENTYFGVRHILSSGQILVQQDTLNILRMQNLVSQKIQFGTKLLWRMEKYPNTLETIVFSR